jgi:hypothetical protein
MHRSIPAVLLSLVYAAALAVALADVGSRAISGAVVLAGLTARWVLRDRVRRRRRCGVTLAAGHPHVAVNGG